MSDWVRDADGDSIIDVWVVPGASRTEVVGIHDHHLKVRVAEPAEGGRASRAVIELLAARCGTDVDLQAGPRRRSKRVRVRGISPQEVRRRLLP